MALVTVTGNVWDHSRSPIASAQLPRLWFVPVAPTSLFGLMTGTEVQASLTASTGAFSVQLEDAGVYRPRMDWLLPGQESEPPERRARGFEEWPFTVSPGPGGGRIDRLPPFPLLPGNVLVQVAPPPAGFKGWWLQAGPGDPDNVAETGTGELRRVF